MENKLLIWSQDYDITNHYCIIDKNLLNDYIKYWVDSYIKEHQFAQIKYLSHSITVFDYVDIKFERGEYISKDRVFPAEIIYAGFGFIELNKITTWKPNE